MVLSVGRGEENPLPKTDCLCLASSFTSWIERGREGEAREVVAKEETDRRGGTDRMSCRAWSVCSTALLSTGLQYSNRWECRGCTMMEAVLLSTLSSSPIVEASEGKVSSLRSNMKEEVSTAWEMRSDRREETMQ